MLKIEYIVFSKTNKSPIERPHMTRLSFTLPETGDALKHVTFDSEYTAWNRESIQGVVTITTHLNGCTEELVALKICNHKCFFGCTLGETRANVLPLMTPLHRHINDYVHNEYSKREDTKALIIPNSIYVTVKCLESVQEKSTPLQINFTRHEDMKIIKNAVFWFCKKKTPNGRPITVLFPRAEVPMCIRLEEPQKEHMSKSELAYQFRELHNYWYNTRIEVEADRTRSKTDKVTGRTMLYVRIEDLVFV